MRPGVMARRQQVAAAPGLPIAGCPVADQELRASGQVDAGKKPFLCRHCL